MKKFIGLIFLITTIVIGFVYIDKNLTYLLSKYYGVNAKSITINIDNIVAKEVTLNDVPGLFIEEANLTFNHKKLSDLEFSNLTLKNSIYNISIEDGDNKDLNIKDYIDFIKNPPLKIESVKLDSFDVFLKYPKISSDIINLKLETNRGLDKNKIPDLKISTLDNQLKSFGTIDVSYKFDKNPIVNIYLKTFLDSEKISYTEIKKALPEKLKFNGKISIKSELKFIDEKFINNGLLKIKKFMISDEDYLINNLNSSIVLDSLYPLKINENKKFTIDSVTVPFLSANKIEGFIKYDGFFKIINLSAITMDGVFTIDKAIIYPLPEKQDLIISLNKINLKRTVDFLNLEDFNATGVFKGEIPITFYKDATFSINNGSLKTISKGKISYNWKSALNSPISNLALAAKVLNALKYKDLSLKLSKERHGNIIAILDILGKNRNVFDNRLIKLKIDISGAILETIEMTWDALRGRLKGLSKQK